MGLLDKIKTMFTEEVEEDEPIKKEVIQVEIPSPAKQTKPTTKPVVKPKIEEMKKTTEVVEEIPKKEEKFKFPVYFDDKDFDRIETKPKDPVKPSIDKSIDKISTKISSTYKGGANKPQHKEEKKVFKPTPIISPVYGVLDKNYSQEDVITKPITNQYYKSKENVTIDDIRQKAYGTLEEDLENTMFGNTETLFENKLEPIELEKNIEELEEEFFSDLAGEDHVRDHKLLVDMEDTSEIDAIIKKYDEPIGNDFDLLETPKETTHRRRTDIYEEENKKIINDHNTIEEIDEITENDIFNLIDDEYDGGDE